MAINRLTHKRNALCVSIHVNAAGDGSRWYDATGWSAYTSVGTTKADTAARFLSRAAYGVLSPKGRSIRANSSDGVSNYERDFYVMDAKNYLSSGELLHFKADGSFDWKVSTGDIPGHAAFVFKDEKK